MWADAMHITFLTSEYPTLPTGGIGTSIQNLSRELVKQGHRVTVLGWGKKAEFEDQGVTVRFLQSTKIPKMGWLLNRTLAAREINRMVGQEDLNIVEAPDWVGLSAGIKVKCPLVVRCHGSDTYFGHLLGYRPRWRVYWAEKLALLGANSICAVSQFTAEKTKEIFGLSKPIRVIPNGVDVSKFHPLFGNDSSYILYFGTLVRKKGVLDLARIFSLVVKQNPDAQLLMIGRDAPDSLSGSPSTWQLFCQMATPEALSNTQYLGPLPYEKVVEYVQKAAVCVFPSYAETFGLAWVEAMACAKPVVASNIGWASEIVEDGVSGILIHPSNHDAYAEALIDLLGHPGKRKSLGQNARERVMRLFSIQRVAELSLEWYRDVIDALD